jgi:hypothetical protein
MPGAAGGPQPGDIRTRLGAALPCDTCQAAGLYVIDRLWARPRRRRRPVQPSPCPDYPGEFVGLYDVFGAAGLALPPDCRHHQLTTALAGLADYPLYDEDDHTALTVELADQAWQAWLGHDVTALIADDHGVHPDTTSVGDDELRDAFYRLYADRFGDEYADTATSVTFPHLDQAVALLADRLRATTHG